MDRTWNGARKNSVQSGSVYFRGHYSTILGRIAVMTLIIFYIIEVVLFGVLLRSIFAGAKLTASPAPNILDCILSSLPREVYVLYLLVLMGELGHRSVYTEIFSYSQKHLVMVTLMIIRIERSRPHPALLKVLIRDGVFYCICGVLLSTVNVAIWIRARVSVDLALNSRFKAAAPPGEREQDR
ncbi:hypothetical protein CONPUDRAFT_73390 [Coniophora puteana RWD-64-598 SS2]|uniref:Uncharacterized protein n=1 Tax=Coniophora puteana (strain RWD-64-598) TaxID=741705 RepID=A0A5M3MLX5_CONPW|nr:uncharacterized protein CONPUDRAFT_73390 [Coniophora puteana RWD-64-598 SS2]EIW80209.1 hypothetical protein CONPUDRAFT_73390 [Coniophora puteana RWD-64-598 SS2]